MGKLPANWPPTFTWYFWPALCNVRRLGRLRGDWSAAEWILDDHEDRHIPLPGRLGRLPCGKRLSELECARQNARGQSAPR